MPGQRHEPSIPLAADVDIGNVNLLDDAGTKLSGTIGDAADVDGTLVAQLRYIGEATYGVQTATEGAEDELDGTTSTGPLAAIQTAAEGAEDELDGTTSTGPLASIVTAIQGAEDELDGTTTTGPLAKIAHTNGTLAFARIDLDLTGGSYGTLVAASGSNKIYVVEIFLTNNAQCECEFVEDPAGTPAILTTAPPFYSPAYGRMLLNGPNYRFATNTVNKALGIDEVANGTVNLRGYLWYYYAA